MKKALILFLLFSSYSTIIPTEEDNTNENNEPTETSEIIKNDEPIETSEPEEIFVEVDPTEGIDLEEFDSEEKESLESNSDNDQPTEENINEHLPNVTIDDSSAILEEIDLSELDLDELEGEETESGNSVKPTIKGHIFRIALLAGVYYKQKEIAESIKAHPFLTICIVGFLLKYAIDSYRTGQNIKKDLDILKMIQELYYLILYATEINNIMKEVSSTSTPDSTKTSRSFNTLEHFDLIVKDVPYTFRELEQVTRRRLIKWKQRLKEKYPNLQAEKRKRNQSTLYIKDVDETIPHFYQKPTEEYQGLCSKIAKNIKVILHEIEKIDSIDS